MVGAPIYKASYGTSNAPQSDRIPAWKKLGLKLKHAQDTTSLISSSQGDSSSTLKRSLPNAQAAPTDNKSFAEPLTKKRRVDSRTIDSSRSRSSLAKTSDTLSKEKSAQLKKKVSFTAETKIEDGGKELYNEWEQDDFAYYEQKAAENDAKEALRVASGAQNQPQKLTTRSKKPSDAPRKSKDALDYLNLHHRSPSSWKFSKNREVWILRRILSTDDIPASFNIALATYVHGLRSRQARSRLLDQCHRALQERQERSSSDEHYSNSELGEMDDPDRRKAYHDDAVTRFKRSLEDHLDSEQRQAEEDDPEYQRWISRRRRAELLLWAVTPSTSSTEESSSTSHGAAPEPQSPASAKSMNGVRPKGYISKRKNRTAVVVEGSSSSEEDSGSSDDEDDGGIELANGKSIANGSTDAATTSTDDSSSAASSVDSDSTLEAESDTVTSRPTTSTSSSDSDSETETPSTSGKRQHSIISISSRSDISGVPTSSTSDDSSSATSSIEEDEED